MLTPTFALFYSQYDWLIVALIVLVLFGGAKIPQLAKGLGEGIREFKKSVTPEDEEAAKAAKADEKKAEV